MLHLWVAYVLGLVWPTLPVEVYDGQSMYLSHRYMWLELHQAIDIMPQTFPSWLIDAWKFTGQGGITCHLHSTNLSKFAPYKLRNENNWQRAGLTHDSKFGCLKSYGTSFLSKHSKLSSALSIKGKNSYSQWKWLPEHWFIKRTQCKWSVITGLRKATKIIMTTLPKAMHLYWTTENKKWFTLHHVKMPSVKIVFY